jgi:hypothetical protein
MESPNIAHVPLNPAGALELNLWPCDYCDAGWGQISSTGSKSCKDTCQHYRKAKKSQEILKSLGLNLKKGETLKIVKVKKQTRKK